MNLQDLSLKECAEVCKVSVSSVRRKRDRLAEVGAVVDSTGWHVTIDQLIAVGLTDQVRAIPPEGSSFEPLPPADDALVKSLREQIELAERSADQQASVMQERIAELKDALLRERARADQAEARYDRLIEAAPAAPIAQNTPISSPESPEPVVPVVETVPPTPTIVETAPVEPARRRRWPWSR